MLFGAEMPIKITNSTIVPSVERPKSILEEADKLINGDRLSDYGTASENFGNIAKIWSVVLKTEVTPEQVALCMIGLKMVRAARTPDHHDSWVDIAGYVACADNVRKGK